MIDNLKETSPAILAIITGMFLGFCIVNVLNNIPQTVPPSSCESLVN